MSASFQPTPDGFDDALQRSGARRRRRHLLEAAAGGTTLAVIAAVVLTTHPGGLASVRERQPAGPGSTDPAASSSARPTQTSSGPPEAALLPTGPALQPITGGSASVLPTTAAAGSPSPAVTGASFISSAPSRRTTRYSNLTPCADVSGRPATGWCVQPGSSFTGRAGHLNTLAASLCRLPGVADGQASFPTSLELSFAIRTPAPADRAAWDLGAQHPGHRSPHTIAVSAGQCLTWSANWLGRDNAGRNLPAGHYTLVVTVNTDDVGAPNSVITEDYDYTISS